MYAGFYNLRKEPFHITPDPEFLFLSPSHKQALASIVYGVEERKGFVAVVGEVGVGKTTILRSYLERVDKRDLKVIYLFNPKLHFEGLLDAILRELELEPQTGDVFKMVNLLHHTLIDEYKQGRNVVLIIDEAQNMPMATLEDLRMLSNLETSKEKLLQILLIGQPELEKTLNRNELRQLKQRIAIYSTIKPLTPEESLAYIQFRLSKVARKEEAVFSNGALKAIIRQANGNPRIINILCDNALITGFGYEKKPVTKRIVKEVIADFEGASAHPRKWKPALPILAVFLLPLLWGLYHGYPSFLSMAHRRLNNITGATQSGSADSSVAKGAPAELRKTLPLMNSPSRVESEPQEPPSSLSNNSKSPGSDAASAPSLQPKNDAAALSEIAVEQKSYDRPELLAPGSGCPTAAEAAKRSADELLDNAEEPQRPVPALSEEAFSAPGVYPVTGEESTDAHRAAQGQKIPSMWKVKRGDSLSRIAAELVGVSHESTQIGVLIQSILEKNPQIKDADKISVGDSILLPSLDAPKEGAAN